MLAKFKKLNLRHRFTLRTALTAAASFALIVSATVFMAVSAADSVSPSDVSGGDMPKSSASHNGTNTEVSLTDVSPTDLPDAAISQAVIRAIRSQIIAPAVYATPENLGEPVITMTTDKAPGEKLCLNTSGENVYVDYGDGTPVAYPGDRIVKGSMIKIYGNITGLRCSEDGLTSLDVSKNTNLTKLFCEANQLTTLDVSRNTALIWLSCGGNQLTALDVSRNTALISLSCGWNQLTALDVSRNTALIGLCCDENQLTALDVSKNTALEYLECDGCQLSSLTVSECYALQDMRCDCNQLTSLDVSGLSNLEFLYANYNQLTTLNLAGCTSMFWLQCCGNQLTSLDVSDSSDIDFIECYNNSLSYVNLPSHPTRTILLECQYNRLNMTQLSKYLKITSHLYYYHQTHVIPSTIKAGENIDLSSEYSVDGTVSQFTWYDSDGNVVNPATANGGVFTFGEDAVGKTLICKMTNAKLPDFCIGSNSYYEDYDEEGNPIGQPINEDYDDRLTTTAVTIESTDPVSSEDSSDNNGNGKVTPYYDLPFEQNEDIDDVTAVKYPEGTVVDVDGRVRNLHSLRGIQLTVGNIETNKKKSVLDAIKHYNESFDTDTTDIALYDITLEDNNKVHVKIVHGELLICLKYPDNLARQSEDYVFHLYHQKDDGTIEEIPITLRPNGIWFRAKEFSPYALYWHVKSAESVGTGESMTLIIVMTVLCALSLAGAGYVLYRRKRQPSAE